MHWKFWQRASDILASSPENPSTSLSNPAQWLVDLFGGTTDAGVLVSEQSAMRASAVYACVTLIAKTIGSLPLKVYRRKPNGDSLEVPDTLPYYLLHDEPNPAMTSCVWREFLTANVLLGGNAYAAIGRNQANQIVDLFPIPSSTVTVQRVNSTGKNRYTVRLGDGSSEIIEQADMLHIPGMGYDGLSGKSIITWASRQAVGLALAEEQHGAKLFSNGARLGVVLKHPKTLSKEAQQRLKTQFDQQHGGLSNAFKTMVLEEGLDVTNVSMTSEDAQYLECVTQDTLLTMADGRRRAARYIQVGDLVSGWNHGPVAARVAAVGPVALKPIIRLTTARGRILIASSDHPILCMPRLRTPGGRQAKDELWMPLGALKVGMYVRTGLGHCREKSKNALGRDTGWFLGAMVGNGYIPAGKACSFSTGDVAVAEECRRIVEGFGGSVKQASGKRHADLTILTGGVGRGGSSIRQLLNESGLVGSHAATKRVPLSVIADGPEAWAAFLSGYIDADGTVARIDHGATPQLSISSVNRTLLEDCQHLFALLGVQSGIYLASPAQSRKIICGKESTARACYALTIANLADLHRLSEILTLAHPVKRARLEQYQTMTPSRYRSVNTEFDRVVSVESLPPDETIGIEIEGVHTHITNGLVTHNSRRFQVEDIARFFGVPPHMIGHTDKQTSWGAGIEQNTLGYLTFTLIPWLTRFEQEFNRKLFPRSPFYAQFKHQGLMRGDSTARSAYYASGHQNGWLTTNEIRKAEDLQPMPGGDTLFVQTNLAPMQQLVNGGPPTPTAKPNAEDELLDEYESSAVAPTLTGRD
jgi:HK97 family phage portal protein